jgi:uncharacterized damage-inducible protein DinB
MSSRPLSIRILGWLFRVHGFIALAIAGTVVLFRPEAKAYFDADRDGDRFGWAHHPGYIKIVWINRIPWPCSLRIRAAGRSHHRRGRLDIDTTPLALTPANLLDHWQGHRRLTRRVIEAFPEEHLFDFSIGGMRPFGVMTREMIRLAAEMLFVATGAGQGAWDDKDDTTVLTRTELLALWDACTEEMNTLWLQIPSERYQETVTAFGQWTAPIFDLILYAIDNEVHHRGEGSVYLRALGIEPPPFYDRR